MGLINSIFWILDLKGTKRSLFTIEEWLKWLINCVLLRPSDWNLWKLKKVAPKYHCYILPSGSSKQIYIFKQWTNSPNFSIQDWQICTQGDQLFDLIVDDRLAISALILSHQQFTLVFEVASLILFDWYPLYYQVLCI